MSVNPLALHQGLNLFKKHNRILGHDLISMSGNKGVTLIVSFMDLPEVFNGLNIKIVVKERRHMEFTEVNSLLEQMGQKLTTRHNGRNLYFKSLSELGAHIYQMSLPVDQYEFEHLCLDSPSEAWS
jgi:hypothetical protein